MRKQTTGNERIQLRTNTILYKNINLSHFIFEKVMFVVCEKWVETRTDCYIDPRFSSAIAVLLSILGLGCLTVGHWGPQSPQSASWFSLRHPVSNWLEPPRHLFILFSIVHLLPLFFRLFAQVHLLIDGSVESQYITFTPLSTVATNSIVKNYDFIQSYISMTWQRVHALYIYIYIYI